MAAAFGHWGVDSFDSLPKRNKIPTVLNIVSNEEQLKWLFEQAEIIRYELCPVLFNTHPHIEALRSSLNAIFNNKQLIDDCLNTGKCTCL